MTAKAIRVRRTPRVPWLTDEQRAVVHAVGGALHCEVDGEPVGWFFLLGLKGDLTCRIFADPVKGENPQRRRSMSISFTSASQMQGTLEAALVKRRLPKGIVDQLLAVIPDFVIKGEAASMSGKYIPLPPVET
jgi:hypothetical protein